MIELLTTRHNALVDPSLHVWGWRIPVYLFLGGWVAGIDGARRLLHAGGRARAAARASATAALVSAWCCSVWACVAVPGPRAQAVRLAYVPDVQPRRRCPGARWILLLVYPGAGRWRDGDRRRRLARPLADARARFARAAAHARDARAARLASMVVGIALGVYTGILLSCLAPGRCGTARCSACSSWYRACRPAAAFAHLVAPTPDERGAGCALDNWSCRPNSGCRVVPDRMLTAARRTRKPRDCFSAGPSPPCSGSSSSGSGS